MTFKVGDEVIALKERPVTYNVTTDKVVCRVLEIIGWGAHQGCTYR